MDSKTKNKKTRQQIEKMAERAFNGATLSSDDDAVIELTDGFFNAVYKIKLKNGRQVILKIAPPKDADVQRYEKNIMRTEVNCMCLVHEHPDIPVPEIYFYDDTHELCDADYYFMEKISGENFYQVKDSLSLEVLSDIQFRIGEIIHAINGFRGLFFGYEGNTDLQSDNWKETFIKIIDALLDDGRQKDVDFGFGYIEIQEIVLKNAAVLEEIIIPQLIHWDGWDGNFFVQDGIISGLIDFERALWGDPLMEMQFRPLLLEGNTNSIRGYGKTDFTPTETMRCQLYSLYLALAMYTESFYRNYDNDYIFNIAAQMLQGSMRWLKEN
ncbi:MAG: aminoglycoside phosphotransferase family protein [Anaerolineaceae bacterium]|nr:aminoglycoside phosphotransferase family protein [Anaerolineaceae bacterium]